MCSHLNGIFIGNIRFRFLISFNLFRFKETKNRKIKSKVIDSILDQLIFEGCRFLKEALGLDQSNSFEEKRNVTWEIMNIRESRTKVAHALRDKRQNHDLSAVLARLKARTGVHDNHSDLASHSHYIAANAMLLTVKISLRESEARVHSLLCNTIDSVGLDTGFIPTFETNWEECRTGELNEMSKSCENVSFSSPFSFYNEL